MRVGLLTLLLLSLVSCAQDSPAGRAAALAAAAGFQRRVIQTERFSLLAYLKGQGGTARIYIEGDGHAWQDRFTPADDPTPQRSVALELATADPFPAIAYLARPCQYTINPNKVDCSPNWWTTDRYHEAVVRNLSQAVDTVKSLLQADRIELVGYSGGGAIAALLAARRHDILNLRTVAANLDTVVWTTSHRVSPLSGSLNPADFANRLAGLPQRHFVGIKDTVVDEAVVRAFMARLPNRRCATVQLVAALDHADGWRAMWRDLVQQPIGCVAELPRRRSAVHETLTISGLLSTYPK